jgi:hypothetical protein
MRLTMPQYPHQNPTVVPAHDVWSREQPTDLPVDNSEARRLSRVIHPPTGVDVLPDQTDHRGNVVSPDGDHYAPSVDLNTGIPQWVRGEDGRPLGGTMPERPPQGPADRRPRGAEVSKFIDDGGRHFPQPHATRNPDEFRTEAEARAEVERLRKDDPNGNYLVVSTSSYGDLWIVARRGELQQVLDAAQGKQQPNNVRNGQ